MKSITASSLAKSVLKNPLLSALLTLVVLAAGIASGSVALIAVSIIMAFGRPFFYVAMLNAEEGMKKPVKTTSKRVGSIHLVAAGTR